VVDQQRWSYYVELNTFFPERKPVIMRGAPEMWLENKNLAVILGRKGVALFLFKEF